MLADEFALPADAPGFPRHRRHPIMSTVAHDQSRLLDAPDAVGDTSTMSASAAGTGVPASKVLKHAQWSPRNH